MEEEQHMKPVPSALSKARSVRFADPGEDNKLVTQASNVSNVKDSPKKSQRTTTASWLSGKSKSKRRLWRKVKMYANPRYWMHTANKRLPILMPETPRRRVWDFYVLGLVVYTAVMVPFNVGFGGLDHYAFFVVDRLVDATFWVDICLNLRTAYVDHSANTVRDGGRIAMHYARTWFPIDLAASIPFDIIILWFVSDVSKQGLIALGLLRTPRLLRLGRLLRYFDRMKAANIVRMGKLLFFMALVAHWVACMWFMLFRLFHKSYRWSFDLVVNASTMTHFLDAYLQSFLLMIGNDIGPLNNLERLYCTGILVIGACFYAIVVGHMSLLVNNMNPTAARHKFKKDIINNTIRYLGAPVDISERINQYFDYLTTYAHPGPDGMALISQLPNSMFQDISAWMYKDLVTKVPLFKECEPAFITQLVIRLKMAVFLPGEMIFRIGDVGHEVYFITKGHVAVMNEHSEMLSVLHKGGFFGELALLATARRTAQCSALCHCDLVVLMAHDLVSAMKDFPDSAEKVRFHAVKRLNDMQTAGKVAHAAHAAAPSHLKKLNPAAAEAEEQAAAAAAVAAHHHRRPSVEGDLPARPHKDGDSHPGAAAAHSVRASITGEEEAADVSTATMKLVEQVQSTIDRLSGKLGTLQEKMGKIHSRLGRVEANPTIFHTGGAGGGDTGNKGSIFDVDF